MLDVVAIGEVLIDFSPAGTGPMGNPTFEMNPGGAPANCLAANAALGGKTAFIGMVGDDYFGNFVLQALADSAIGISGVKKHASVHTTLAFVSLSADGERSFSFFRNPGADIMLRLEDVDFSLIDHARIVHFGSLSMTDEPARSTLLAVLEYARDKGKTISYDPNYRPALWQDETTAAAWMNKGLEYADIVKMSQEEMALLLGIDADDVARGAARILATGKQAVFITCGARGAYYAAAQGCGFVPGFAVQAVDTTGCGDAFTGTVHYFMQHHPEYALERVVRLANAVGALCATQPGGLPALPSRASLAEFLTEHGESL
ncbi:MAG: carbohydrate kinase [Eubacteriales bacterium]|nr:carbohydrate kinase [Eubacteriales bacterium]